MSMLPRDLYLDLLVDCLSNLVHGPLPADPWNDGLFRRDAPAGRDADSPAHTMVGILRLRNLRQLTQQVIDDKVAGDLIETGVWRGGCCILMRGVLAANADPDRRVFVANSFAGVPPPRPDLFPADAGDTLHMLRTLAIPADQVRANFARYGLLDDRVMVIEGWFSDTLPRLADERFALLRLDGDLYEFDLCGAGQPVPAPVARRLRHHRRLRRHSAMPAGGDGVSGPARHHRADHRDRLDRRVLAQAVGTGASRRHWRKP